MPLAISLSLSHTHTHTRTQTGHTKRACLLEERLEGVVSLPHAVAAGLEPIRLDAVLQAVQLPAGIADLTSGLPQVNRDDLAHGGALAMPVNVDMCTGRQRQVLAVMMMWSGVEWGLT